MNINNYIASDGWVKKEKDNVVKGRLIGRYKNEGSEIGFYYKVRLDSDCKVITGVGDKTIVKVIGEGSVVNVDEVEGLKELIKYVSNGGVYDVWILYGQKKKLENGKTYWPILNGPRVKVVKKPPTESLF